jgi:hypothetical protein
MPATTFAFYSLTKILLPEVWIVKKEETKVLKTRTRPKLHPRHVVVGLGLWLLLVRIKILPVALSSRGYDGRFSIVFGAAELPYVADFIVGSVWLDW